MVTSPIALSADATLKPTAASQARRATTRDILRVFTIPSAGWSVAMRHRATRSDNADGVQPALPIDQTSQFGPPFPTQ
jgi:hypothetical protein